MTQPAPPLLLFLVVSSAIGYYILSAAAPSQLLAATIIGAVAFWIWRERGAVGTVEAPSEPPSDRREMISERYYAKQFPRRRYKYLVHNPALGEILNSLKFTRMFNRAGYDDLALYMDRFQKIYMYILSDRYYARSYIDTWLDLRESILEILYGLVFVVPDRMRHSNIDPYERVESAKKKFAEVSERMTRTLRNYMLDGKGEKYFPEIGPRGYEAGKEDRLP